MAGAQLVTAVAAAVATATRAPLATRVALMAAVGGSRGKNEGGKVG